MGNSCSESRICSCKSGPEYYNGEVTCSSTKLKPSVGNSTSSVQNDILTPRILRSSVTGTKAKVETDKLEDQLENLSIYKKASNAKASPEIINSKQNGEGGIDLPKNVLYYGWSFSSTTSSEIKTLVMHLYECCRAEVSQFEKFIDNCCKDADIRDPLDYYGYKRPGKRIKPDDEPEYHVTVKFLGREPDAEYQTLVHPFLEKTFYIHLVGVVFTPRTLGVRVKLTKAQQLIFDEKDEYRNGRKLSCGDPSTEDSYIRNAVQNELESYSKLKKMHKSNPKCKFKKNDKKVVFKRLDQHTKGSSSVTMTNSRAHITIACAPNVRPKQTGDDLVDIIDLEQRNVSTNQNFQQDYKMKHGTLRQFGRPAEAFVLYPELEMIVPGVYNFIV